jgi:hypothetical protein
MATAAQRREILEEIKASFEEEVLMSFPQREKALRTGGTDPYYVYGLTICTRIPYFSNEIIGRKLTIRDFPELLFIEESEVYGKTWFCITDVESRIKALEQAIKYNIQWN